MVMSFGLTLTEPTFIHSYGWTPGVYGFLTTLTVMLIAGYMRPVESHVGKLWSDIATARGHVNHNAGATELNNIGRA